MDKEPKKDNIVILHPHNLEMQPFRNFKIKKIKEKTLYEKYIKREYEILPHQYLADEGIKLYGALKTQSPLWEHEQILEYEIKIDARSVGKNLDISRGCSFHYAPEPATVKDLIDCLENCDSVVSDWKQKNYKALEEKNVREQDSQIGKENE